jgi:hypothetical protein
MAPLCQCCQKELHGRDLDGGRQVCRHCEDRLGEDLAKVGELWEKLPALLEKGAPAADGTEGVSTSGPTASQAPGNLAVLSLLAGGVTGPLLVQEDAWRRELRKRGHWPLTPRRGDQDQTLRGVLRFLSGNLHWACHDYDSVDDLDKDLGKLLGEMRGVVSGDRRRSKRLPVPCPLPAPGSEEDDPQAPACGGTLTYYSLPKVTVRCDTCRRTLPWKLWHRVGLAAGLITLPDAA